MGWKVRSNKLKLVNARVQDRGGRQQVRWKVAQYKIKEALAVRKQTLEDGLDITDFQYLAERGVLIGNAPNLTIEAMPELNSQKFQLEDIKDYFIPYYSLSIENFLNDYLRIKDNSHGTWTKFLNGQTAIEYEAFKTICTVLGWDCDEIGRNESKIPEYHKELEILLWKLNHHQQITRLQQLAQDSHNLVCLKFSQVPETKIPIYWLIQTLVQPFDGNIENFKIKLTSGLESNYKIGINRIVDTLKLPGKLKEKKNFDAIAKEIHRKVLKKQETTVLLFLTEERKNVSDCDELVNQLYHSLKKIFVIQKPPQKFLMVWIDLQPSSQWESNALEWGDDNDFTYNEIPVSSKFNTSDIKDWTIREEVRSFIKKTINLSSNDPLFNHTFSEIWDESQEGRPEFLLKSFYSLFDLELEYYQSVWQDKV
jgi:hypothetical protein